MASCSDDVIWTVINNQFCAFKITTPQEQSFCRNEYNVTGVCSRITCPLANSQYATVRNIDGQIYLYMKTPERQHLPNKWWQRIKLSQDYDEAQKQVDEHLIYWPERLIDRCKQRLTRLTQVQLAERRLALQQDERHYTTKSSKVKRREASRERKALVAAKLERAIERELLERLKSGAYGEQPLNVEESVWKKIMAGMSKDKNSDRNELELEDEDQLEEEEKEKESNSGDVEFVEDDEDDDDLVDVEDIEQWLDHSSESAGSDSARSEDESDSDSGKSDEDSDSSKKQKKKPQPKKRIKAVKPPAKRRNVQYEYEYEEDRGQVARA